MKKINIAMFIAALGIGLFSQIVPTKVNPGQVTLPPAAKYIPTITVYQVSAATPNTFPVPPGTTVCIVSRNIPQSLNIDYTINSTNQIVFNPAPQIGDVIQLNCF